jgi:hypothetical protein
MIEFSSVLGAPGAGAQLDRWAVDSANVWRAIFEGLGASVSGLYTLRMRRIGRCGFGSVQETSVFTLEDHGDHS